jgi:hypothetical protein
MDSESLGLRTLSIVRNVWNWISWSNIGDYEQYALLGCDAM